jgi:hypothetical protein
VIPAQIRRHLLNCDFCTSRSHVAIVRYPETPCKALEQLSVLELGSLERGQSHRRGASLHAVPASKAPICPMVRSRRTGSKTKMRRTAALRNSSQNKLRRNPNMRTSVGPHSDGENFSGSCIVTSRNPLIHIGATAVTKSRSFGAGGVHQGLL